MNLNEKIKKVYELKTKQEEIQAKQEELKQQLNDLTQEQEKLSDEILIEMKTNNVIEQDTDNLVAQYFSKNEFSYGDEKVLLSKLKELCLDKFIKTVTKTTTSSCGIIAFSSISIFVTSSTIFVRRGSVYSFLINFNSVIITCFNASSLFKICVQIEIFFFNSSISF